MDAAFLPRLREASQQRREQSADFAKLLKNIERFETTRQRIKIPLQEEKFFAFRQSDEDQEQAADAVHDEPADKGDVVVKRDFYFNEVLAVTADYLRLLAETKLVGSE